MYYNNNLVVLRKYVVEFVDILLCDLRRRKAKEAKRKRKRDL